MPVQVHMFVLGPLRCSASALAVLLLAKQRDAGTGACHCKSHFGVYTPKTGVVRLRSGTEFQLRGTGLQVQFDANLPLSRMTGCAQMSYVQATLDRACHGHPDVMQRFDETLAHYLQQCTTGFHHVVDWDFHHCQFLKGMQYKP